MRKIVLIVFCILIAVMDLNVYGATNCADGRPKVICDCGGCTTLFCRGENGASETWCGPCVAAGVSTGGDGCKEIPKRCRLHCTCGTCEHKCGNNRTFLFRCCDDCQGFGGMALPYGTPCGYCGFTMPQ